jgi:hypothetical protein
MTKDNNEQLKKEIESKIKNKSRIRQNYEIIKLLFKYIMENKKWWLIPFLIVLAFFGIFISFVGNSSVMPILYVLF